MTRPHGAEDAGSGPLARAARSWSLHLLLLALPFVAVLVWTHGLGGSFPGLQAGDEPQHWATVRTAADAWPVPVLRGYATWSGPLVYWLLAALSLPLGGSLAAAQVVVAGFSWGTCAIAYVVFRRRLGTRPSDALVLALMLAVSPFFFGQSFRVLTDNPTWFFVALALERLLAYASRPKLARFAAFAACLAAASLMRQISVWLLLPGLVALLGTPASRGVRRAGVALLAAAIAPLAALLVVWGGPLPPAPGGLPAPVSVDAGYRYRNLLLTLGVAGWYALFLLPSHEVTAWARRLHTDRTWVLVLTLPAAVALVSLLAGALGVVTSFLGLVSRFPQPLVRGSGLLWWGLVPLGAAVTAGLSITRRAQPTDRILVSALAGVLVSALANPRWYERYVDAPLLLLLAALATTVGAGLTRLDRERWALAFAMCAAAYALLV